MCICGLRAEGFEEAVEGEVGIAFGLVEEGHKLGTNDGTGRGRLGCREGLGIADAEANHAGIAQVHLVDTMEVGLLGIIEGVLRTCDGSGGYHIDEAVGIVVDEADALIAGFGSDEHDDPEVITVGDGFDLREVIVEGKVRDDDARDSCCGSVSAEAFDAIVEDGVEIAHEDERYLHLILDRTELLEEEGEGHPILQCLGGGTLNDGTVGEGIAEGDADFNEVDATALKGEDDIRGAVEGRAASTEVEGEELTVASVGEKGIYLIHCC